MSTRPPPTETEIALRRIQADTRKRAGQLATKIKSVPSMPAVKLPEPQANK